MKDIKAKYYIFDFCCGELMIEEEKESSTEVDVFLQRHMLEDPVIIYGFNVTNYFIKGE